MKYHTVDAAAIGAQYYGSAYQERHNKRMRLAPKTTGHGGDVYKSNPDTIDKIADNLMKRPTKNHLQDVDVAPDTKVLLNATEPGKMGETYITAALVEAHGTEFPLDYENRISALPQRSFDASLVETLGVPDAASLDPKVRERLLSAPIARHTEDGKPIYPVLSKEDAEILAPTESYGPEQRWGASPFGGDAKEDESSKNQQYDAKWRAEYNKKPASERRQTASVSTGFYDRYGERRNP